MKSAEMKSALAAFVILILGSLAEARPPAAPAQSPATPAAAPQAQAPAATSAAPPQPAPAPSAPAEQAPQTAPSTSAPKPSAAILSPDQLNELARKIYDASYRIADLLSLVEPDKWPMNDSDRKFFGETLDQLRAGLKNLEAARLQFSGQPQNPELGDRVAGTLRAVLPDMDAVGRNLSQYAGPTLGGQYKQAEDQLAGLGRALEGHLGAVRASLTAPTPANAASNGAPETEVIKTQSTPPPATTVEEAGYLLPDQVKPLLHRLYVATFRINDLLSQVHPGRWKVPEPVRDYFNLRVAAFQRDAKTLEAARSQFAEETDDPYLGYRVYEAIPAVVSDLKSAEAEVGEFAGAKATAPFEQPGQWIEQSRAALGTYVDFLMRNRSQVIHTYEANLASCQNTLNYALRGEHGPAQPMEPVRFVRPLQSAKIRRKQEEEAAARAAAGASSGSEAKTKEAGEGKTEAKTTQPVSAEKPKVEKKAKRKAGHHTKPTTTAAR